MYANRVFNVLIALVLLGTTALVFNAAATTSALVGGNDAERARAADVARWVAKGEAYADPNVRAREADVARWVAMGRYYASLESSQGAAFDPQRTRNADTARWVAMGEAYKQAAVKVFQPARIERQLPDNRTCVLLCGGP